MANCSEVDFQSVPFETGLNFLPYRLFMGKPEKFWNSKQSISYYVLIILICFLGIPSLLAILLLPETVKISSNLKLPYFRDYNVLFMCAITLPGVFYLLMTERKMISESVNSVLNQGTLTLDENRSKMFERWKTRYANVNVIAQVIGLIVGAMVAYGNYATISSPGFKAWQVSKGVINIPGYVFILVQLPTFFFFLVAYLIRTVTHCFYLHDLARNATFSLSPIDYENAGGLRPLGRIGLRNQYLLALGGLNIGFFVLGMQMLGPNPMLEYLFIAALGFYVVAGPIGFLGPLLPFRSKMLETKRVYSERISKALKSELDYLIDHLQDNGYPADKHQLLKRYEHLQTFIRQMPVWPFDSRTVRKFLLSYIFPFGAFLLGPIIGEIAKLYISK